MQDPNRLRVTERAHILAIAVYRLTSRFPSEERFGLAAQMRRAAISIGSNIAEGCGRRRDGELLHFLYIASGSARELAFQARLAREFAYGDADEQKLVFKEVDRIQRMLNRLTRYLGQKTPGKQKEESATAHPSFN